MTNKQTIEWKKYPENRPERSGNYLVWGYFHGVVNGQETSDAPYTRIICADGKGNFNSGSIVVVAFTEIPIYDNQQTGA